MQAPPTHAGCWPAQASTLQRGSGQSSTCIFFEAPQLSHAQLGMSWQSSSSLHASRDGSTPVASRVALPVAAPGVAGLPVAVPGVVAGRGGGALVAPLGAGDPLEPSTAGCGVAVGAAQLAQNSTVAAMTALAEVMLHATSL